MTAEHLYPTSPAKFSGWALPIPNLPRPALCEETSVLNFFGNALLHGK
jgi:hypothetical protein